MSTLTTKRSEVFEKDFDERISELSSRSGDSVDIALLWQQRRDLVRWRS